MLTGNQKFWLILWAIVFTALTATAGWPAYVFGGVVIVVVSLARGKP